MARPGTRSALRWLVLAASFALGAYVQAGGLLPSILRHSGDVIYLARQHLWLVAVSGGLPSWSPCRWASCSPAGGSPDTPTWSRRSSRSEERRVGKECVSTC